MYSKSSNYQVRGGGKRASTTKNRNPCHMVSLLLNKSGDSKHGEQQRRGSQHEVSSPVEIGLFVHVAFPNMIEQVLLSSQSGTGSCVVCSLFDPSDTHGFTDVSSDAHTSAASPSSSRCSCVVLAVMQMNSAGYPTSRSTHRFTTETMSSKQRRQQTLSRYQVEATESHSMWVRGPMQNLSPRTVAQGSRSDNDRHVDAMCVRLNSSLRKLQRSTYDTYRLASASWRIGCWVTMPSNEEINLGDGNFWKG